MTRPKIPTLQPRIKMAPTFAEAHGIKTAKPLRAKRTGRDADPRRTLPLNGAAWQRLRASVLADEPLCRMCWQMGRTTAATDVDHMHGSDDNRRESLQPLCHSCHSRKTQRDMGRNVSMGCDTNGMPLDPAHPWNNEPLLALLRRLQKSPATDAARPTGSPSFNPQCLKNRQL